MAWSTLHDTMLTPGDRLNINISSYQFRIPIIKIRRSGDRLIFIMAITKHGKTVFILRRGTVPWPISTSRELCIRLPLCYILLGLGTKISKEVLNKIFSIILPFFPLTHWSRDKICAILQTTYSNAFSNWQYSSTGSVNGLASTRRQPIIWSNDG